MSTSTPDKSNHMGIYLTILLILVLLIGGFGWQAARRSRASAYTLTHPEREPVPATPDVDLAVETVTIPVDNLTLQGWFTPPDPSADGASLLFVHGFSGNRTGLLDVAARLHADYGYGALLIDLRNHGESEGEQTTWGYAETADVVAAFRYLAERPEVNGERIALYGKSMGGATVLLAASQVPAQAVVAESAYNSLPGNMPSLAINLTGTPPRYAPLITWFAGRLTGAPLDEVAPLEAVPAISHPLLFIHGAEDGLVDPSHSESMYAAATAPKEFLIIPNAAHVGVYAADPEAYMAAVGPFLAEHLNP